MGKWIWVDYCLAIISIVWVFAILWITIYVIIEGDTPYWAVILASVLVVPIIALLIIRVSKRDQSIRRTPHK